ncbi:glucose-1-phosphatase-like [Choristoneura fumiferana]|uniref:glucose-1-phosphatase-like n=1 Tax=Choristoneura fumiferana TaxID=7141 RepID=UPI003D15C60C
MCAKLFVLIFTFLILKTVQGNFKLLRVVALSRHNVRSPLADNLDEITPKPWPQWSEKRGYLTTKGAYLEGLMGTFFSKWLFHHGVLPAVCPDKKDVFVYANVKQRTLASAQAFVDNAFPGCNTTVHAKDKTDPVFNPVIHNSTDIFKRLVLKQMQDQLNTLSLSSSYEVVEEILDYKDSFLCKNCSKCDLVTDRNQIDGVVLGQKPVVNGPLKISKGAIDAFKMQYYNGFPLPNVAWGKLDNDKKWEKIIRISKAYHSVIFNSTIIARDIASPLLNYMKHLFVSETTKFTLIMGHDANIFTILSAMSFKPYILQNQFEMSPVGGKIVFQKWMDQSTGLFYLKIHFVYASTEQIRNGMKLTLTKPPQFQLLELKGCPTDSNGFCLWDNFLRILADF